ncbi:MAG TPA: histidine phosphatase family protein [Acidimicrobiales bacterium]|nr:histidine phosphatase family protein [Acidimicrobiales bacterium]
MPDDTTEYTQRPFTPPPGASQLLLVRHGASAPYRVGEDFALVDGHGDPPLDPIGHHQAERVAERLAGEQIAAIYVTSLQRTVQTAEPLASRLGIEPIVESDLREVLLGEWEGGAFRKHVAEGHPIAMQMMAEQRWDVIPGAESSEVFTARIVGAVERIAARHVDEFVVVFTHGAVIAQLLAFATGARRFSFISDNASISHLIAHEGRWFVRRYNDTTHLHAGFTTAPEPMT